MREIFDLPFSLPKHLGKIRTYVPGTVGISGRISMLKNWLLEKLFRDLLFMSKSY